MTEFDNTVKKLCIAISFILTTIATIITLICIYTFSDKTYTVEEWLLILLGCLFLYLMSFYSICLICVCISNCIFYLEDTNEVEVTGDTSIIIDSIASHTQSIDDKDNLPPSYSVIFN